MVLVRGTVCGWSLFRGTKILQCLEYKCPPVQVMCLENDLKVFVHECKHEKYRSGPPGDRGFNVLVLGQKYCQKIH